MFIPRSSQNDWHLSPIKHVIKELTRWKRPWCWEGLGAGGEGDDRGWDSWMASPTRWAWVWANSRSLWWTGRPGVLRFMGSQRVRHDWATELNWGMLPTTVELLVMPVWDYYCFQRMPCYGLIIRRQTLAITCEISQVKPSSSRSAFIECFLCAKFCASRLIAASE